MQRKYSTFQKDSQESINIVKVMLIKDANSPFRTKGLKRPDDAASVARKFLANEDREVFIAINLDHSGKINSIHVVAIGNANATIIHPREVFKTAILSNASSIVIAHNHPSGNSQPSDEDTKMTSMLIEAGRLLGIKVLDHIIIGDDKYTNLSKSGQENGKKEYFWISNNSFEDDQATSEEGGA